MYEVTIMNQHTYVLILSVYDLVMIERTHFGLGHLKFMSVTRWIRALGNTFLTERKLQKLSQAGRSQDVAGEVATTFIDCFQCFPVVDP